MSILLAQLILLASTASQGFVLPTPTGQHRIGTSHFGFVAGTPSFRVPAAEPVQLWYPAEGGSKVAPYVDSTLLTALVKGGYYEQSTETIQSWSSLVTHSYLDARLKKGKHALLILLPGAGVCGFQYTALAEEFASRGCVVAVLDYYAPTLPERKVDANDSDASTNDIARLATAMLDALAKDRRWNTIIDFDKVAAAGHSIGGAAAISAARFERRIKATVDMDGGTFGESTKGAVAPVFVLRSKPIYSDEDLKKRGRTREQFEKAGQEARRTWLDFQQKSGKTSFTIYSVMGTGHFSFSDAPFTMPDAIARFGGEIIDPSRGQKIITTCVSEFLERELLLRKGVPDTCSHFEEIVPGIPPEVGTR